MPTCYNSMKRKGKKLQLFRAASLVLLASGIFLVNAVSAKAAEVIGPAAEIEAKKAAESFNMVQITGTGGCSVTVTYLEQGENGTMKEIWTTEGVCGRNGISEDKAEGDGKTPAGSFYCLSAFGLNEDPGSILPYHRLQEGDVWVDDPESIYYNKMVYSYDAEKDWVSAENMTEAVPEYNYGLVLNYNQDCVPGKGSAIFIHCFQGEDSQGSAGCIRISEEKMAELIQKTTEYTKVLISPAVTAS